MPASLTAHEAISEQIAEANKEIQKAPTNADLYLKRGELYRIDQHWHAALSDYDRALRLNRALVIVDFLRGRMLFDAGKFSSAKRYLDLFLSRQPANSEALLVRGRVEQQLRQYKAASTDFTNALRLLPAPKPENFIERADAEFAQGHTEEALSGLDEGIQKLGPIVTLQLRAIDLEIRKNDFENALHRLDTLAAQSPRKESWLVRRGEILLQAGKVEDARSAFSQALTAIESLPADLRSTNATMELERNVRDELNQQISTPAPVQN